MVSTECAAASFASAPKPEGQRRYHQDSSDQRIRCLEILIAGQADQRPCKHRISRSCQKEPVVLEYQFVEKGTIARLNPQKRILRLVIGGVLVAYYVWQFTVYEIFLKTDFLLIPWGIWFGVIIPFYFLSDVVNIEFNRRWGRWPQYGFLILLGVAILFDWIWYRTYWGPPAGWLVSLMSQITGVTIAIAHVISAVLATPG
ncbi:MAG: hypothetical protein O7A69_09375 [SAR324 cluster bacterium]|nr:hypothetical protein [SAR324 cluster bacterium]